MTSSKTSLEIAQPPPCGPMFRHEDGAQSAAQGGVPGTHGEGGDLRGWKIIGRCQESGMPTYTRILICSEWD